MDLDHFFPPQRFQHGIETPTTRAIKRNHEIIATIAATHISRCVPLVIQKEKNASLAHSCLKTLRAKKLDTTRPFLAFWAIRVLELCDEIKKEEISGYYNAVETWVSKYGGIGVDYQLRPHMISTYATCLCIAIIQEEEGYELLLKHRNGIITFLKSVSTPLGVITEYGGELDIRAAYSYVVIQRLLGITNKELGFSNESHPSLLHFKHMRQVERHCGNSFCEIAGKYLYSLNCKDFGEEEYNYDPDLFYELFVYVNLMTNEGGFAGRNNKLVDSCYTFWCGATIAILTELLKKKVGKEDVTVIQKQYLYNYVHLCQSGSGVSDSPQSPPDIYHTCYSLSGLATLNDGLFPESDFALNINRGKGEVMMKWFLEHKVVSDVM